jgi:iron uptake system EfeUOB component EfeO/EfeM
MKTFTALIALSLMSTIALSGCSSQQTATPTNQSSTQATSKDTVKNEATPNIKDGVAKLLHTAKQVRKGATKGDEAIVRENGPKLEEIWSSFEDGVKEKYPDVYKNVEEYLDPTIAATKAKPIDKAVLLKIDNQLIDELYGLSEKLISVDEIKAGVSEMLETTAQLKQAIEAGDQAKVKELGPKLEETWSSFEDGVKPRYGELYEKLEKPLNPEVAGSQVSPLDKETLEKLNNELTQALNELMKKAK